MARGEIKGYKIIEEEIVTRNGNIYPRGCLNTKQVKESIDKYLSSHPEIISEHLLNVSLSQKGFIINEYKSIV